MCGRYAATATTAELVAEFDIEVVEQPAPPPNHNVAPTDPVAIVVERIGRGDGTVHRKLVQVRWGLVPSWSKDPTAGARMINARSETVSAKPAFRNAFAARRCLVPALGYYEWRTTGETGPRGRPVKQPWFIRPEHGPLAMAGLYEFWRDPRPAAQQDPWLATCTVITTRATDRLGHLHDRMPMIIAPENRAAWLDPTLTDPAEARGLLGVDDTLDAYEVSRAVNSVHNNGPELIEPLAGRPH